MAYLMKWRNHQLHSKALPNVFLYTDTRLISVTSSICCCSRKIQFWKKFSQRLYRRRVKAIWWIKVRSKMITLKRDLEKTTPIYLGEKENSSSLRWNLTNIINDPRVFTILRISKLFQTEMYLPLAKSLRVCRSMLLQPSWERDGEIRAATRRLIEVQLQARKILRRCKISEEIKIQLRIWIWKTLRWVVSMVQRNWHQIGSIWSISSPKQRLEGSFARISRRRIHLQMNLESKRLLLNF